MKSFITYLTEKKDHIIKRLKNLTDDEKDQVIAFFAKKPNLENKINWNNRELTFKDFQEVMDTSKTERRKAVKKQGIAGLKKGKDYLELVLPDGVGDWNAYIPLHREASILIGSNKIGGVATKWCISGNDKTYWTRYIYHYNLIPVMFIHYEDKEKYVLMLNGDILSFRSFWDKKDTSLGEKGCKEQFGSDWKDDIVTPNVALLKRSRTILDKADLHWFEQGIKDGKLDIPSAEYTITNNKLIWKNGIWRSGVWKYGLWEDGTWKDGTWYDGNWLNGNWEYGIWEDGTWKGGDWWNGSWRTGTWEKGTWRDGEWLRGLWEGGTWEKGTWYGGTWENGIWEDGVWHKGRWEDGTWEDGRWMNGTWENGTWKDGTWFGGTWKGGVWENGTWKGGTWEKGTWQHGIWEGGYDKNGVFHEDGDTPDKWNLK